MQIMYQRLSGKVYKGCTVGQGGLEPPTSPLSGVRSNQLSYRPMGSDKNLRMICDVMLV